MRQGREHKCYFNSNAVSNSAEKDYEQKVGRLRVSRSSRAVS